MKRPVTLKLFAAPVLLLLTASSISCDQDSREILFKVGKCSAASCKAPSAQLTVLMGKTVDSSCVWSRHELGTGAGDRVISIPDPGDEKLTIVLAHHCRSVDKCARCVAVKGGIDAENQTTIDLDPAQAKSCLLWDDLPTSMKNASACGSNDAGLKDIGILTDRGKVDQNISTKDISLSEGSSAPDWNMSGKCANDVDAGLLNTQAKRDAVTAIATTCGLGCVTSDGGVACSAACVAKGTGLSAACSDCYAGIIACTVQKCLSECATDPNSIACTACMIAKGCYSVFYTCSGMPQI